MIPKYDTTRPSQEKLAINVMGQDAAKFLQGQLTCDVYALQDGQSTLGAYCNIKGKVESMFYLSKIADSYRLEMPTELIAAIITELKKYAVFSKVKIDTISIIATTTNDKEEILAKIPAIYPATVGMFFPHDLNLPGLGAVSFTKGCYRGQEIVARMQHRGKLKRGLYIFTTAVTEINPGDAIIAGTKPAGTVVRTYLDTADKNIFGLAVITDTLSAEPLSTADRVAITLQS